MLGWFSATTALPDDFVIRLEERKLREVRRRADGIEVEEGRCGIEEATGMRFHTFEWDDQR